MGKSLIIKGADFSANGFNLNVIRKTITKLVNYDGIEVTEPTIRSESIYFYEHSTTGEMLGASNLASSASTNRYSYTAMDLIDVEDYTEVEITTRVDQGTYQKVGGLAVLFFLDSSMNLIGGLSSATQDLPNSVCERVGISDAYRTFVRNIPFGAKYIVCTCQDKIGYNNFKLELRKYEIA